jgi:hypothetical protein
MLGVAMRGQGPGEGPIYRARGEQHKMRFAHVNSIGECELVRPPTALALLARGIRVAGA